MISSSWFTLENILPLLGSSSSAAGWGGTALWPLLLDTCTALITWQTRVWSGVSLIINHQTESVIRSFICWYLSSAGAQLTSPQSVEQAGVRHFAVDYHLLVRVRVEKITNMIRTTTDYTSFPLILLIYLPERLFHNEGLLCLVSRMRMLILRNIWNSWSKEKLFLSFLSLGIKN